MRPCNKNINSTLEIIELMLSLANKGDAEREDVGCGILFGVLRDSAYKLKKIAEAEIANHKRKGWWEPKS